MTRIYLAYSRSSSARTTLYEMAGDPEGVNLLVSFVYLSSYRLHLPRLVKHPHTILDSGAFSAWKSGKSIDIDRLIEETKDPCWGESVSLDVIGDPEASVKNALYMKGRGSPAYPVFHYGDPWEHLQEYKRQFPKVGLSCRFGEPERKSLRWLDHCFATAWPYRFHSFGWVKRDILLRYPFHTADTASWSVNPGAFGSWISLGLRHTDCQIRGTINLQVQVEFYRRLQRECEGRWAKELAKLDSTPSGSAGRPTRASKPSTGRRASPPS